MIERIQQISDAAAMLMIFALCGAGIYFTWRLRLVQVRRIADSFKLSFGSFSFSGAKAKDGGMSSFQSLATAIAAQVGAGNIAGAATAIISGGPGAIFWMWLSAFLGMATAFAEATLAQKYRTTADGRIVGGPAYYLRRAFPGTLGAFLAGLFALVAIITLGFSGNMVQINSLSAAFHGAFAVPPLLVGMGVALLSLFVFRGGVQRIASVVEKLVPLMALIYILAALQVIAAHAQQIIPALQAIVVGAFNPQAAWGGAAGISVRETIRYGIARGVFSNEAGMGSAPHAHAVAKVKHPCEQGLVAMLGVFIDTFIILSLTALVILTSGVIDSGAIGIALAQAAFDTVYAEYGAPLIAVCMFFFVFSSIIGWYFFAELNVRYLFGERFVPLFALLVFTVLIIGSMLQVELVWALADLLNGLMVIPNIIGLFALSGVVFGLYGQFER